MKKSVLISVALATFLSSSLFADNVAQKEAAALSNPKVTFGDKDAKAKIQEAQSKLYFQKKIDAQKFEKEALTDESKKINYSVSKEANYQNTQFKQAPKEIVEALDDTIKALVSLNKKDVKSAKELLSEASKKFEVALKANPNLNLVPIAKEIEVREFAGDINIIKKIIDSSIKLLQNKDTQAARAMLLPLQDEMVIRTQFIPMKLYPLAATKAKEALDKNNALKAVAILSAALNTIAQEEVIIPIPLLVAQDLVTAASKIDKQKKKDALALLNAAKLELEKAMLLGYTKKYSPEYQGLNKEIEAIKKEINGKNEVAKLYEHILNSFKKLIDEVRGDKKAKAEVTQYQKEQLQKAIKLKDEFSKAAKADLNKTEK
jgi:hypothetical protein